MAKTSNIYWRDIPMSACVIEKKHTFEVKVGRSRKTAYWMGQESREAQRTLSQRAKRGCS